jgi:hypothetical protein
MDKKILEKKLDNVGLWSWFVGIVTLLIKNIVDNSIDSVKINPSWVGDLLSWLVWIILIFVSLIIVGIIIRKNRDKGE